MVKEVEDTRIYQAYYELIAYMEMITEKYPRSTKSGLVANIKTVTYDGLKDILYAYKAFEKKDKLKYLNELDINLKVLKVLVRVSNNRKYISKINYAAWSRKIHTVCVSLGGWINSCLKP